MLNLGGSDNNCGGASCLLCYAPVKINFLEVLPVLSPSYGSSANANMWALFVLRKLLLLKQEDCYNLTKARGGVEPIRWVKICGKCSKVVGDFRKAYERGMEGDLGAESTMKAIQKEVKNKLMLLMGGCYEDVVEFLRRAESEPAVKSEEGGEAEASTDEASNNRLNNMKLPNAQEGDVSQQRSPSNPGVSSVGTSSPAVKVENNDTNMGKETTSGDEGRRNVTAPLETDDIVQAPESEQDICFCGKPNCPIILVPILKAEPKKEN